MSTEFAQAWVDELNDPMTREQALDRVRGAIDAFQSSGLSDPVFVLVGNGTITALPSPIYVSEDSPFIFEFRELGADVATYPPIPHVTFEKTYIRELPDDRPAWQRMNEAPRSARRGRHKPIGRPHRFMGKAGKG